MLALGFLIHFITHLSFSISIQGLSKSIEGGDIFFLRISNYYWDDKENSNSLLNLWATVERVQINQK